jgi:hypothetical protein
MSRPTLFAEFVSLVTALLGVVFLLGATGWQVLQWLKTGQWVALPFASFGLATLFDYMGHAELAGWAQDPEDWIGVHKALNWFSVGAGPGILLLVISQSFEASARRGIDKLERRERYAKSAFGKDV